MRTALDILYAEVREREHQAAVLNDLRLAGFWAYHVWTSIHSAAGYPDIDAFRTRRSPYWGPPFELHIECKVQDPVRGTLSEDQEAVGAMLREIEAATGGAVAWRLVRPSDRPALWRLLMGETGGH